MIPDITDALPEYEESGAAPKNIPVPMIQAIERERIGPHPMSFFVQLFYMPYIG